MAKPKPPAGYDGFSTPFMDGVSIDLSVADWNAETSAPEEYKEVCPRGFCVNTDGNISFVTPHGRTVTRYVVRGMDYPWAISKFLMAGTDAALRVAGQIIAGY